MANQGINSFTLTFQSIDVNSIIISERFSLAATPSASSTYIHLIQTFIAIVKRSLITQAECHQSRLWFRVKRARPSQCFKSLLN